MLTVICVSGDEISKENRMDVIGRLMSTLGPVSDEAEIVALGPLIDRRHLEEFGAIPSFSEKHNEFWYYLNFDEGGVDYVVNLYFVNPSRRLPDAEVKKFLLTGKKSKDLKLRRVMITSRRRLDGRVEVFDSESGDVE